ncbi:MAG: RsmB/NOP family class I SAM-dependent RNA methyltransferase [Spirochaetota bacterium]|nr:RsmB/NOP family class I SAM-dependent RNA methyltransferase [Spirochaetota bacterium]
MGEKNKHRISFDEFYADLFDSRWPVLREALLREPSYHALHTDGPGDQSPVYYLDEASYRTALLLQPDDGDEVLDMCAAPGGKSLTLITSFPSIRLTSNERSANRRFRLKRVLQDHLSSARFEQIRVTGYDARTWFRHEKNAYDRILLDVPCSSERHILNSQPHYSRWSPSRTNHLAVQAFAMLASALEVVRPQGIILYCTCALSPLENDGVIEKLHRKRPDRFEIVPVHLPFGEKTRYGWQVLPDDSGGRGPMYAAGVRRTT